MRLSRAAPLLALIAAPALAAETLPLAHGTYVAEGTPCADPPFAAMRSYDGIGLADPHTHACRARILSRKGSRRIIANSCIDVGVGPGDRVTDRLTIDVLGQTRFREGAGAGAGGQVYRLCPPAGLPPSLRGWGVRPPRPPSP